MENEFETRSSQNETKVTGIINYKKPKIYISSYIYVYHHNSNGMKHVEKKMEQDGTL